LFFPRQALSQWQLCVTESGNRILSPMKYDIAVERKATYLQVTGTGALNEANARRFLVEAYQAALAHKCDSLLLEMGFSGSMDLGKIYSVIAERSTDGAMLKRIAYVDLNPDHLPEAPEFAELVALNRGVNVRLFRSLAEAERWLQA